MADTQTPEPGTLELPETKPYRVLGVGAVYNEAVEAMGQDGVPHIIYVTRLAPGRTTVELTAGEARRLKGLGAIREADEARGYEELYDDQLAILATQRGLRVVSSSADPDQPLRDDYINALRNADIGSDEGVLRGVASAPGGVVVPDPGSSEAPLVLVDGVHPNPPTEQADDVDTSAADESAGGIGRSPTSASAPTDSGVFDARGKSATELSDWISSEKPNATKTVAAAHDDPATAATLIEAENAAQQGDGRATVVDKLKPIADREG